MKVKNNEQTLEDAIIDLYLHFKIRKSEAEEYNKEREQLKSLSPFLILKYIRTTVAIMNNLRLEKESTMKKSKGCEESIGYEKMIQQFEEETRFHIGVICL